MADVNPSLVAELLQESLQRGQTPFVTITSNSMAPLLRRGDQIGLEALPAGQLRPGDIILLRAPGELVCHRYWGNPAGNPTHLLTRGDRSLSFDTPWTAQQFVGRVIVRRRGQRELWLNTSPGRGLNHQLHTLAQAESRLFAGFAPHPQQPEQPGRALGRQLRQNSRYLPARIIRRALYSWAWLLATTIALLSRITHRGTMASKRSAIASLALLLLLTLVALPLGNALASVSLSSFSAQSQSDRIILTWVTVSEIDTLGFNVWRGTECNPETAVKVNSSVIPAQGGGATGATYQLQDTNVSPNILYDYRLEDLENSGTANCHQEPEFQVRAAISTGGALSTPTPTNGGGGGVATSTSAPTNTPAPTNTAAPTATPRPAGQLPTATLEPAPTALDEQDEPPPPAGDAPTDIPPVPTEVIEQTVNDTPGDAPTPASPTPAGDANTTADAEATAIALAALAGDAENQALANAGSTTPNPQTIGQGSGTNTVGDSATDPGQPDASPADSGNSTLLTLIILAGGLLFTLGGIGAIWYFVINRQSG